jgi:hypothetical protein
MRVTMKTSHCGVYAVLTARDAAAVYAALGAARVSKRLPEGCCVIWDNNGVTVRVPLEHGEAALAIARAVRPTVSRAALTDAQRRCLGMRQEPREDFHADG